MTPSTHTIIINAFNSLLGCDHVLSSPVDIKPYCLDGRGRYQGSALAVLFPKSTEEVSRIMACASEYDLVVIAQGGNTSNVQGATPSPGASQNERLVIVNLSRMRAIDTPDTINNTICVEAGAVLANVQEAAKRANRLFALSLAAQGSAQIGGCLACNAGGVHVLRYGMARSQCLGLEVVLADGRVLNLMRPLRKDNSGYDLRDLFIGSEGTLGIITRALLKLEPLPVQTVSVFTSLNTLSQVETLFSSVESAFGPTLSAFELMGENPIQSVREVFNITLPVASAPWYVLFDLSLYDTTIDMTALEDKLMATLSPLLENGQLCDAALAMNDSQAQAFWNIREHIPSAVKKLGGNIKHDISVSRSRLVTFIEETCRRLEEHFPWAEPSVFGHYGDGNLHFNIGAKRSLGAQHAFRFEDDVHRFVHDAVIATNGSIAAEHGVGAMKVLELERTKTPLELELMRTIKTALDPDHRLNPNRVIRLND